jgi:cytochrome P450
MGISEQIYKYPPATIVAGLFMVGIIYLLTLALYGIYFSPLAKFPGPKLAAATALPKLWHLARGEAVSWVTSLHQQYGPIVRVSPTELSFTHAQAWQDIYGFQPPGKAVSHKDAKFYEFGSLEVKNIINAEDQDHARTRRVFSHAFSDRALKEQEPLLVKYINLLGQKLQETMDADPDAKIDMVKMLNFTTFDVMGMILSLLPATCN